MGSRVTKKAEGLIGELCSSMPLAVLEKDAVETTEIMKPAVQEKRKFVI